MNGHPVFSYSFDKSYLSVQEPQDITLNNKHIAAIYRKQTFRLQGRYNGQYKIFDS